MKSIQFYSIINTIKEKRDIFYLLRLYRICENCNFAGRQASKILEEYYLHLKCEKKT